MMKEKEQFSYASVSPKVLDTDISEKQKEAKDRIKKIEKKEKLNLIKKAQRRKKFRTNIEKAGLSISPKQINDNFIKAAAGISIVLWGSFMIYFIFNGETRLLFLFLMTILILGVGYFVFRYSSTLIFNVYLDYRKFRRRLEVEEVLPDFLQLTSANIRAGMPIDRALWFAIRPRFGILSREIEQVAKETIAGKELYTALREFAKKYDSKILERSMNLLIEGIEAGGEIGELLDKISDNIQETRLMRKEMAASVMTYVIFITFAAIVMAPIMFGLSKQLLVIIQKIISEVNISDAPISSGFGFSMSGGDSVDIGDFQIFALIALSTTAFFSSVIITTMRKGNVKEGLKYIPIYLIVAITVYIIASAVMGKLLGGIV